jgi:EAL and modified HD-GYP domain-containing signal transduction protein
MELSVYLARQPIFDLKGQIVAYELLYRDTDQNATSVTDNLHATARVLVNALNYIGLNNLTKGKAAFVKIDDKTLKDDIVHSIAPTHFVLEILDHSEVDEALAKRVAFLKGKGYRFALSLYSDETLMNAKFKPLLELVDFVKIDVQQTAPKKAIDMLKGYGIACIAEKIENNEEYEAAQHAGFELFQGYLFAKPHLLKKERIDPDSSKILELIYQLKSNAPMDDLIATFNTTPYLTANLLKFIRLREGLESDVIESVEQALVLIGRERLTNWLELLAYAYGDDIEEGGPYAEQLSQQARQRASLMESLARKINRSGRFASAAYMTGLLSMSEVLFQDGFESLIKQMHLEKNIADALIKRNGELGQLLELSIAVEQDDTRKIHSILGQLYLSQEALNQCLVESYSRNAAKL